MTRDPVSLAEIEHDRRESDVDEDEAAEFWEAHEETWRGYYEARRDTCRSNSTKTNTSTPSTAARFQA